MKYASDSRRRAAAPICSLSSRDPAIFSIASVSPAINPSRLVGSYLARGRLRQPKRARKFVYPVYVVYPEARNEEAYEPILNGLRQLAAKYA